MTTAPHGEVAGVRASAAQFSPSDDPEANLRTIAGMISVAAAAGSDIVVLPEYSAWFASPLGADARSFSGPLDGAFAKAISALAISHDIAIVAGYLETAEDADRVYNTVFAVDATGARRAVYRKMHLFDSFGSRESEWVRPGPMDTPETFLLGGMRFGLQTCFDIRFPEVSRHLADAGVDVIVIPAQWVPGPLKIDHWRTLARARAIENTAYVIAADQSEPTGVGHSMVIGPDGDVEAETQQASGLVHAWISRHKLDAVRRTNPVLRLRRFAVVPKDAAEPTVENEELENEKLRRNT